MTHPQPPTAARSTVQLLAIGSASPVEELLRLFVKAARNYQLYPANNPILGASLEALRSGFAPVWEETDELVLAVSETELRWGDQVVHRDDSRGNDALPWTFYKDGIRELRLLPGVEGEEVVKLLDILQRGRVASPEDDDLLTLLWEAEFTLLRYRYVDLTFEGTTDVIDGTPGEPPEQVDVASMAHAESASGIVNVGDFDSTLYFLDEREIEYLQAEVRREYAADLRGNVVGILLDIWEQQNAPAIREEVGGLLEHLLLYVLSAGQFRTVATLLREAGISAGRASNATEQERAQLTGLATRLSEPDSLSQLVQSLDEAAELPPEDELTELFALLRPTALETVFRHLATLESARLRPVLERAADRLATANTSEVVRLIEAPEESVAVEAIRRAGALRTPAAVAALSKALSTGEPALRQAAASALAGIASPGAMQALERSIEDSSRDVRIIAVRALGARSHRVALPRVEAVIKGKTLRTADLTEKMAFFETFGALAGDGAVSYLDEVLNGKGFFGRREDPEWRACAAVALGRIGSGKAQDVLRRAAAEKDVVVRNAVGRALRGGTG